MCQEYSVVMVSLSNTASFTCRIYSGNQTMELRKETTDIDNESVQCIDNFCYLTDMTHAWGGTAASCRSNSNKLMKRVLSALER